LTSNARYFTRLALAVCGLMFALPKAALADTLSVCLEENSDPYSWKHGSEQGGFDLKVAAAVAAALGKKLTIQWFETENEEESFPDREANALISAGLCDLVAGYPMFGGALAEPASETALLPGHEGQNPATRHQFVELGVLAPSRPYHHAPLQVIVGPKGWGRLIETLSDLNGLSLGAEQGTLTDTIFMAYRAGYMASRVIHVVPQSGILSRLEEGAFDAILIELHRFDAYRRKHPDTQLRATNYRHALGFNMGFVGLKSRPDLLAQVNDVIDSLATEEKFAPLADSVGMTFIPPNEPEILDRISPGHLFGG
jgi:ABC-type amino acid transport substrate-binding protein